MATSFSAAQPHVIGVDTAMETSVRLPGSSRLQLLLATAPATSVVAGIDRRVAFVISAFLLWSVVGGPSLYDLLVEYLMGSAEYSARRALFDRTLTWGGFAFFVAAVVQYLRCRSRLGRLDGLSSLLAALFVGTGLMLPRSLRSVFSSSYDWAFLSLVLTYFAAFFFVTLRFERPWSELLLQSVGMAIAGHCGYAIAAYCLRYEQHFTPGFGWRAQGLMSNPLFLYPVAMIGLFLGLALSQNRSRKYEARYWQAVSLVCLVALILTFARSAWIGITAGLLAFGFWKQRTVSRCLIVPVFVVSVLCFSAAMVIRSGGKLVFLSPDGGTVHRLQIWQASTKVFLENPIWGSGFNTYRERQKTFTLSPLKLRRHWWIFAGSSVGFAGAREQISRPRSGGGTYTLLCVYLHVAVEFGLVGLALLALAAISYRRYFRGALRSIPPDSLAGGALLGMHWFWIALSVAWITDSQLFSPLKPELTFIILTVFALTVNLALHGAGRAGVTCSESETEVDRGLEDARLYAH